MNYDLALMALDGIARAPLTVRNGSEGVVIEASPAAFKELARLCLLLGASQNADDAFDLTPGQHTGEGSPALHLRIARP